MGSFLGLHSIPLILFVSVPVSCSFYHNCSVVQLEVRHGDSTRGSFIVGNSCSYTRFFVVVVVVLVVVDFLFLFVCLFVCFQISGEFVNCPF